MKNSTKSTTRKFVVDLAKWKQQKQEQRTIDKPITYVVLGNTTRVDIPPCTVAEFVERAEAFTKANPDGFGIGELSMLLMDVFVMGVRRERGGQMTDEQLDAIEARCDAASTSPWKVADNCGDDWLVCSLGNSSDDGKDYYVTTDSVRASELSGDASTDAHKDNVSENCLSCEVGERDAEIDQLRAQLAEAIRERDEARAQLGPCFNTGHRWGWLDGKCFCHTCGTVLP